MARTLKKEQPAKKIFYQELARVISDPIDIKDEDYGDWIEIPVTIDYFCKHYLGESLFEGEQSNFCTAVIDGDLWKKRGKKYPKTTRWSRQYDEGHAFWGKGSGKDRTIAKIVVYFGYKLKCHKNPHKWLREKYGASIGDDDNLDIANISINARQAQNVFFKKLKSFVKKCKNPKTGKKWFEEHGMDLRDGYDILQNEIRFSDSITAHSLNSETYTGEGLNLLIVIIDEYGSFPSSRAFDLYDSLRSSVDSRFPGGIGKVLILSYKYYNNDPMDTIHKQGLNEKKTYSSRAASWTVNPLIKKKRLAKYYTKNPENAKMKFECKGGAESGGYVTKKYLLSKAFDPNYVNPIAGNLISVKSSHLTSLKFHKDFQPIQGKIYAARFDLATGKKDKKRDMAGFALVHVEKMFPVFDARLKRDLAKEGIIVEMAEGVGNNEIAARKGIVTDLALQIVADRGSEIQFSDLRNFVMMLKGMGFNIVFVTYDGWQSLDSIQLMQQQGIDAYQSSVDMNNDAYDLWKELMYQQLWKCYHHDIANREAKELELNDKGKVDHPAKSWERFITEQIDYGSKDVMDSIVGAVQCAYQKIPLDVDIFFG